MDRVTRYPILSTRYPPRLGGLALDEDTSYKFELVGVGPEAGVWGQNQLAQGPSSLRACPRPPCSQEGEDEDAEEEEEMTAQPRWPQDLQQERRAVIQGQAVRKSGTVAVLQGTCGHEDSRRQGRPQSRSLEEDVVDTGQIDFLAARQQFLSLEQASAAAARGEPATKAGSARALPGVSRASRAWHAPPLVNGHMGPAKAQTKEVTTEEERVRGSPAECGVPAEDDTGPCPHGESPELHKETPIEREIRLTQEREAELREQRGLRRAPSHAELVRIPARPLLTAVSLPRRDRGRLSLYVQRDIAQETQREEDHRRQGLRARTPDGVSEGAPRALRRVFSSDSVLGLAPDERADVPAPEGRKVNRIPPEAYHPYLGAPGIQPPALCSHDEPGGGSSATGSRRNLSESASAPSGTKKARSKPAQGPPRADGGIVRREYFRLRPLRFRGPEAPQQAEAPRAWGWEVAGAPALRLQRSASSELLEREVESVLRREREMAEERRQALLLPDRVSPPVDEEDSDQGSRSSSRASGTTGSYSVSESHYFFTPIPLNSGLVWTVEANDVPRQRKTEQWYAGINPLDHVNSEVLEATRVTRHKNAMAQRWEAGIYTSEDED